MIPNWQTAQLEAQLYTLAKEAGAKDVPRVVSSIIMAVDRGEDATEMLESVRRNQPRLFYPVRPAIELRDQEETRKTQREYRRGR